MPARQRGSSHGASATRVRWASATSKEGIFTIAAMHNPIYQAIATVSVA